MSIQPTSCNNYLESYRELSKCNVITVVEQNPPRFPQIPFIEDDEFHIVRGHHKQLATGGVATCFAICARGRDQFNLPILGLFHTSSPEIEYVLDKVLFKMDKAGAPEDSVEIFVIGGTEPTNNAEGTLFEETEFVRLAKLMNIKELKFNLMKGETDSLDVVLTAKKIYVSKLELFDCCDDNYHICNRF